MMILPKPLLMSLTKAKPLNNKNRFWLNPKNPCRDDVGFLWDIGLGLIEVMWEVLSIITYSWWMT